MITNNIMCVVSVYQSEWSASCPGHLFLVKGLLVAVGWEIAWVPELV
jgi:hypothetical protein